MVTDTFVTELNESFSTYGLISFSGETKIDNKLGLISPNSKLKFNPKLDVYKNKVGFESGKAHTHTKTSFSTTRNNLLHFGIPCTKKNPSW